MNLLYRSLISQVENKMAGYIALLSYRYQNLCIKADPTSLMPVNVMMAGELLNIEDVATVAIADEYHLAILPNQEDLQKFVIDGIFHSHPEFKLEVKPYKLNEEDRHYLLYEMPEVNKDRHDILEQGVKSLHDECKMRIDEIYGENLASLTEMLKSSPDDLDIIKKELDRVHDDYIGKTKALRDQKLEEIEEAYQRYCEEHPGEENSHSGDSSVHSNKEEAHSNEAAEHHVEYEEEDSEEENEDPGYDVVQGMRMGN